MAQPEEEEEEGITVMVPGEGFQTTTTAVDLEGVVAAAVVAVAAGMSHVAVVEAVVEAVVGAVVVAVVVVVVAAVVAVAAGRKEGATN